MKISIIGLGYVGLCTAMGLVNLGHTIVGIDVDERKLDMLRRKEAPLYEKDLQELLNVSDGRFEATDNFMRIINTELTFICVGTPSKDGGEINLHMIEKAAESVGKALKSKNSYHVVVVKSTVLPTTTEQKVIPIIEKASGKTAGRDFGVCMNPEFLREGTAIHDFLNPSMVIVGQLDAKSGDTLRCLYANQNIVTMNLRTAEMVKYALNAALATKISFINEIGNICKKFDIDTHVVAEALGKDKRISPLFLKAGLGWGGSCFPKDVAAIVHGAQQRGYEPQLLEAVQRTNRKQVHMFMNLVKHKIGGVHDKTIAVMGLAFKAGTDDVRDSPAIQIIEKLSNHGAKVKVYDPKAKPRMQQGILNLSVEYVTSADKALKDADVALIVTDWPEFENLDYSPMKHKVVIDGRNIVKNREGLDYEGLCW